jgi:hypothetical protein
MTNVQRAREWEAEERFFSLSNVRYIYKYMGSFNRVYWSSFCVRILPPLPNNKNPHKYPHSLEQFLHENHSSSAKQQTSAYILAGRKQNPIVHSHFEVKKKLRFSLLYIQSTPELLYNDFLPIFILLSHHNPLELKMCSIKEAQQYNLCTFGMHFK